MSTLRPRVRLEPVASAATRTARRHRVVGRHEPRCRPPAHAFQQRSRISTAKVPSHDCLDATAAYVSLAYRAYDRSMVSLLEPAHFDGRATSEQAVEKGEEHSVPRGIVVDKEETSKLFLNLHKQY